MKCEICDKDLDICMCEKTLLKDMVKMLIIPVSILLGLVAGILFLYLKFK